MIQRLPRSGGETVSLDFETVRFNRSCTSPGAAFMTACGVLGNGLNHLHDARPCAGRGASHRKRSSPLAFCTPGELGLLISAFCHRHHLL